MAGSDPFGILLIDKQIGPTSHDVVRKIRSLTGIRKVGHTGTLDPLASGLLVICLGQATRLSQYLVKQDKRYVAEIRFGVETDSHDAEGEPLKEGLPIPTQEAIEAALPAFRGSIEQRPPAFSAVKVKGKKAYELARAGEKPTLASREVQIHELQLRNYQEPDLEIEVHCSSGTYIRALARDLGRSLETGAHLVGLRRIAVGSFDVDQAHTIEQLSAAAEQGSWQDLLLPAREALPGWPEVRLDPAGLEDIRHGRRIENQRAERGMAKAVSPEGKLVAVLQSTGDDGHWQPRRVFLS